MAAERSAPGEHPGRAAVIHACRPKQEKQRRVIRMRGACGTEEVWPGSCKFGCAQFVFRQPRTQRRSKSLAHSGNVSLSRSKRIDQPSKKSCLPPTIFTLL